jgi:hypothetical protein
MCVEKAWLRLLHPSQPFQKMIRHCSQPFGPHEARPQNVSALSTNRIYSSNTAVECTEKKKRNQGSDGSPVGTVRSRTKATEL